MIKHYLTIVILFCIFTYTNAQQYLTQYFDGADTSITNSIIIQLDTVSTNIWQRGRPQKIIFDSAATIPNAIVTDTIHYYPINNISRFMFKIVPWINWGVLAIQWKQKLDMDTAHDGGIIEFSFDNGNNWENVFNNPHVYNFSGFDFVNQDTLATGEYAFSGTDSIWRDVWLCYDLSWISFNDSVLIRFSFVSDSIDNNKEGWIIDNMFAHVDVIHPVKEVNKKDYLNVYPNPAKDIVNIEIQKIQEFHIIENMELRDLNGKLVKQWKNCPTKFWFDVSKYPDGIYYLKIKTNIKSETIPLLIKKQQ